MSAATQSSETNIKPFIAPQQRRWSHGLYNSRARLARGRFDFQRGVVWNPMFQVSSQSTIQREELLVLLDGGMLTLTVGELLVLLVGAMLTPTVWRKGDSVVDV